MLCVGGPLHGQDKVCKGPYLSVPVLKESPVKWFDNPPVADFDIYDVVQYERKRLRTISGAFIDIWLVE